MDAIDRKIITTLQKQGRITNVELARMNDLAPSSMLERVRRLEDKGIIQGYHAVLDPKAIGYQIQALVMLSLDRHQERGIEIFEKADNPWLKVTLTEGKNQQIRKMFAAVGHPVSKLKRIQFGPLDDPFLKPGEWRFLNPNELAVLKSL